MITRLLTNILMLLPAEIAHTAALKCLALLHFIGLSRLIATHIYQPIHCMGLTFPNTIGLAAGFDKNGEYIHALSALGFGFIEIGTVTPKAQAGNPKPRLFRYRNREAIINRMGFNSKGIDYVIGQLENAKFNGILGINIGKNRDTPNEKAVDDYVMGFRRLAKYASYITINISSPNTPDLRALQQKNYLEHLLQALKKEQADFQFKHEKYVPLVVKISPDLTDAELQQLATTLIRFKIDAVIATNTTTQRSTDFIKTEAGGLSGAPLAELSTRTIQILHKELQHHIPIIASGGIMNAECIKDKKAVGAVLCQIYTGFIYHGPRLTHFV